MVCISVGIVSVTERRREVNNLIASIASPNVKAFYDVNHVGSWFGHLGAMRIYENFKGVTHHLVIEDDVKVCNNFIEILHNAVSAVPDKVISIYASRAQKEKVNWAVKNGYSWFQDAHGASGQGVLFPIDLLKEFMMWERINCPTEMPYEDTRLYGWMKEKNHYTWNTVPSLIEHTQPMNSMLGFNNKGKVAALFMDDVDVDWNKGVEELKNKPRPFKYIGGIKGYTKFVLNRRCNNGKED